MSTTIKYYVDGNEGVDSNIDDPATIELSIYTDAFERKPFHRYFTSSGGGEAQPIDNLVLEVDKDDGDPIVRLWWRVGKEEIIDASNTPSPTQITSGTIDGKKHTDFYLPVPGDPYASYDFTFTDGSPGYPLRVKVKKKA